MDAFWIILKLILAKWGYHRQGSCQIGLGADVDPAGRRLFLGAVGSWYWQGKLIFLIVLFHSCDSIHVIRCEYLHLFTFFYYVINVAWQSLFMCPQLFMPFQSYTFFSFNSWGAHIFFGTIHILFEWIIRNVTKAAFDMQVAFGRNVFELVAILDVL